MLKAFCILTALLFSQSVLAGQVLVVHSSASAYGVQGHAWVECSDCSLSMPAPDSATVNAMNHLIATNSVAVFRGVVLNGQGNIYIDFCNVSSTNAAYSSCVEYDNIYPATDRNALIGQWKGVETNLAFGLCLEHFDPTKYWPTQCGSNPWPLAHKEPGQPPIGSGSGGGGKLPPGNCQYYGRTDRGDCPKEQ